MKFNQTIFIFLFLVTACQTSPLTSNKQDKENQKNFSIFKSFVNGDWVQKSYLVDVSKTKSPYKSKDKLTEFVDLNIDTSEIRSDSLVINASGIHEGGSFIVFFRPGLTSSTIPTNIIDYEDKSNFYQLGYLVAEKDTSLLIYHYAKNNKLLGKTEYGKVERNLESPLRVLVNKMLFTGNYELIDTGQYKGVVSFTSDGSVKGLTGFEKYYIITDFVAEPEESTDKICFDIQTKNQQCFSFEIKHDTICIYKLDPLNDSSREGQIQYKLIKQPV